MVIVQNITLLKFCHSKFYYLYLEDCKVYLVFINSYLCLVDNSSIYILLIFLRSVRVGMKRLTAKPYILQKFYFNEFVANVLHDNIGILIFDLRGHGGCWRPKTPLGGQKWHEGIDLLKKVFK